jgi:hypothetical protein
VRDPPLLEPYQHAELLGHVLLCPSIIFSLVLTRGPNPPSLVIIPTQGSCSKEATQCVASVLSSTDDVSLQPCH